MGPAKGQPVGSTLHINILDLHFVLRDLPLRARYCTRAVDRNDGHPLGIA